MRGFSIFLLTALSSLLFGCVDFYDSSLCSPKKASFPGLEGVFRDLEDRVVNVTRISEGRYELTSTDAFGQIQKFVFTSCELGGRTMIEAQIPAAKGPLYTGFFPSWGPWTEEKLRDGSLARVRALQATYLTFDRNKLKAMGIPFVTESLLGESEFVRVSNSTLTRPEIAADAFEIESMNSRPTNLLYQWERIETVSP